MSADDWTPARWTRRRAFMLTIDVARNTTIGDHFGIWTTGPATVRHAADNVFLSVAVPVANG